MSCDVSVVIVSWNTRTLLRACLESAQVACRSLNGTTEIIVVDNASSDDSVTMMREMFPAVRVIVNAANVGFAAANNQGICASAGRYVLLLNPDTASTPAFLRDLFVFSESHPDAGAVGPRIVGSDGEDQMSCFPLPTIGRELWRLLKNYRMY
jgi:GT2 family glycosyltransferase